MSRQKKVVGIAEGVNSFFHGGVAGGDDSGLGRGVWSAAAKLEFGAETDLNELIGEGIDDNPNLMIGLGVIIGLRLLGMVVSITADLINLKRTQTTEDENNKKYLELLEKRRKLLAALILELQKDTVVVVDKADTIAKLQNADNIADETKLWVILNIAFTKLILAHYRNNLTPYNLHRLKSTLSDITNADSTVATNLESLIHAPAVAREEHERILIASTKSALKKPVDLNIQREFDDLNSPRRIVAQAFEGFGDFFIAFSAGASVTSGLLGLISMIPGINLIAMGVWISALLVGAVFGASKMVKNYYFDRNHTKRRNEMTNAAVRANQVNQLQILFQHAQYFNADQAVIPEGGVVFDNAPNLAVTDKVSTHKRDFVIIATAKVLTSALLGVLLGWSLVTTFNDVVSNLALTISGTVTSLAGNALIAVPVVGAVLTTGMFVAKTAWSLYKSYQDEQALVEKVNAKITDIETRAKRDPTLRTVLSKTKAKLLKEFIEKYEQNRALKTNIDSVESSEEFLQYIESAIGFSRATAKTPELFYGYLAHVLEKDPAMNQADAIALATRVRNIANDPPVIILESRKVRKPELKQGGLLRFTLQFGKLSDALRRDLKDMIQMFKPGNSEKAIAYNNALMHEIEVLIGFNRTEAISVDHFYGFLAYQLLDGKKTEAAEARTLAGRVKNIMNPTEPLPIQIASEKVEKSWRERVFQRNDHGGNLSRLATEFKEKAAFGFASTCTVSLGLGLAATFSAFSGPAFPIVLGVLLAVLITTFIVSKVVEYRRGKRMKEHNEKLATLTLQDKTAEYTKRLTDPLITTKAQELRDQQEAAPAAENQVVNVAAPAPAPALAAAPAPDPAPAPAPAPAPDAPLAHALAPDAPPALEPHIVPAAEDRVAHPRRFSLTEHLGDATATAPANDHADIVPPFE